MKACMEVVGSKMWMCLWGRGLQCVRGFGQDGHARGWGEWVGERVGREELGVPTLLFLRVAVLEMVVRGKHCMLVVPNWAEAWLESVLDGVCWVERLKGSAEGMVVVKGRTEISRFKGGEVGGKWLLVDSCPKKNSRDGLEKNSRRAVEREVRRSEGWCREREREAIVHDLSQMSSWRGMDGGWLCGVE